MYYNIKTVFVGMDVHKESFTLCCYSNKTYRIENHRKIGASATDVIGYLNHVRKNFYDEDVEFVCGYEAGCLGYRLYRELTAAGVKCVILAPTTMAEQRGKKKVKTDKRDAENIAKCLAHDSYKPVYVLSELDEAVRELLRIRGAVKRSFKQTKQQIGAFCLKYGLRYTIGKNYWTQTHLRWLRDLEINDGLKEALEALLSLYDFYYNRLKRFDERIEEIANDDRYKENVQKLICFLGIKTHTALTMLVEIGDFKRFPTPGHFASYLGLTPGEHSSGESRVGTGITKAGNRNVRTHLVESAQCYTRWRFRFKSKTLLERQKNAAQRIVDYADKAVERLRRRYYHLVIAEHKKHNVAIAAVARELACFIWGMLNNEIV